MDSFIPSYKTDNLIVDYIIFVAKNIKNKPEKTRITQMWLYKTMYILQGLYMKSFYSKNNQVNHNELIIKLFKCDFMPWENGPVPETQRKRFEKFENKELLTHQINLNEIKSEIPLYILNFIEIIVNNLTIKISGTEMMKWVKNKTQNPWSIAKTLKSKIIKDYIMARYFRMLTEIYNIDISVYLIKL